MNRHARAVRIPQGMQRGQNKARANESVPTGALRWRSGGSGDYCALLTISHVIVEDSPQAVDFF